MAREEKYVSKRQEEYFLSILPKLDKEIANMDLGMRANTCLVSSNILTMDELKKAMLEDRHIPYLSKEARNEILKILKL